MYSKYFVQFVCQSRALPEKSVSFLLLPQRVESEPSHSYAACHPRSFSISKKPWKRWCWIIRVSEQIEKVHTFVPALLADTFRALNIVRTIRSTYMEYCDSLLQVWFLEYIIVCRPLVTSGLLQEDFIQAHIRRMPWSLLKNREAQASNVENLQSEQLCWKPTWLHISEVIIYGAGNGPLLLLRLRDIETYFPLWVVCQFGWFEIVQAMISYASSSSGIYLASKKQAI